MSVDVRLRRVVRAEYEEAVAWYEERKRGLGLRFAAAVDAMFEAIGEQPDRYPEAWPGTREALVTKWPYCIYFQMHDDHVMVIAVFHTSRDPVTWQRRT